MKIHVAIFFVTSSSDAVCYQRFGGSSWRHNVEDPGE